ncbi:hypothetical protein COLO4_26065 [Corchorus olitorius]|uniref:Uncharacterized protein n=1 Tax=Corchorus olitorius TaxID=93759 RepID=A0A1R3HYS1_9ROSI|nr:hypothetical protein COLO4_26065 [Corchorus olitorius]
MGLETCRELPFNVLSSNPVLFSRNLPSKALDLALPDSRTKASDLSDPPPNPPTSQDKCLAPFLSPLSLTGDEGMKGTETKGSSIRRKGKYKEARVGACTN